MTMLPSNLVATVLLWNKEDSDDGANDDKLDSEYEEVVPGQSDCDFDDVDHHGDSGHNEEMNSSEGAFSNDFHTDEYDTNDQPGRDQKSGGGKRQMTINECKQCAIEKSRE